MNRLRTAILLVIAAATVCGIACKSSDSTGARPGSVDTQAPAFSLQDVDGKVLDLANYRGKVVLLDFWATWCVPCQSEIPHFVEFQNEYGKQGFQAIGISMDDGPKPVREFYQQYKMNYPVAMGTTKLAQSYGGILGLPVTFVIGRDGRIAAKYVGATDASTIQQKIQSLLKQQ